MRRSKIFITLDCKRLFQRCLRDPEAVSEKMDKFDYGFFFFRMAKKTRGKVRTAKTNKQNKKQMANWKETIVSQIRNKLLLFFRLFCSSVD